MKLVEVKEGQFTGCYMRYNAKPKGRVTLPPGHYLKDYNWYYVAHYDGINNKFHPSSKHTYVDVKEIKNYCCQFREYFNESASPFASNSTWVICGECVDKIGWGPIVGIDKENE